MKDLQDGRSSMVISSAADTVVNRKHGNPSGSSLKDPSNFSPQTADNRFTQGSIMDKAHNELQEMLHAMPSSARTTVVQGSNITEQQPILAKCGACSGAVYANDLAVNAIGKTYHQHHFQCFVCRKGLAGDTFFEKNSNPYCEKCMNEAFLLPTCAFCGDKIKGRCINAVEKSWHPEHFFCSQCGKQFPPGAAFLEHEGKAYCEPDYYNMFAPKCATCDKAILDEVISALGKSFHADCFLCAETNCKVLLTDSGTFFDYNGKPYCETHYHSARGSLCASCQKPITGRCITAIGKKFHPEHFVCAFCKKNLGTLGSGTGSFKDHDGKPYCVNCHVKLYA
eukprot:Partr_v1_DN28252_c0_g1_i1_m75411 putative transforming growth factor beta 1 induced transcript 1